MSASPAPRQRPNDWPTSGEAHRAADAGVAEVPLCCRHL